MTVASLVQLLDLCEIAAIEVWLDGGWGIDALLGQQTRPHQDVDVILRAADVARLVDLLSSKGYAVQEGGRPSHFFLAHPAGLKVDVHAITLDPEGNGRYRLANGDDWTFSAGDLAGRGDVGGRPVRCLSALAQVRSHTHGYVPYVPTEKDFLDMERLHERFGVELPLSLRRVPR